MCTVTAYQRDGALLVTMNRDEARSRGPEVSPTRHHAENAPTWIAPHDSDKGGTWMGVNDRGVVACILNRYQDYDTVALPESPESRGGIIPELLRHHDVEACCVWLKSAAFRPGQYPPFTLLLIDPHVGVRLDWSGTGSILESELSRPWYMMSSSFFNPDVVLPWRQAAFTAWRNDDSPCTHDIPTFHLHQPEDMANVAPLMSREISCTRSITQVAVEPHSDRVVLRHGAVTDGCVDWQEFDTPYHLDFQAAPSSGESAPEMTHG